MNNSESYNITFSKFWIHLSTILKHKLYVFEYACMCGIPFRGFIHDFSKFSFKEFWTNVRYTKQGTSPVNTAKEATGISEAWLHHKGRNSHHHLYWTDRFDEGVYIIRMPLKDSIEMICDYLAANKAYAKNKKNVSYLGELTWWKKERQKICMHPDNIHFVDEILTDLSNKEIGDKKYFEILNFEYMEKVYNKHKYYSLSMPIKDIDRCRH